jgi:subtilase family serine protease
MRISAAGVGGVLGTAAVLALGSICGQGVAQAGTPGERDVCPDAPPGWARCMSVVTDDSAARPLVTAAPSGYGPAQLHSAYGLPVSSRRAQTIAIVDAYNAPTVKRDLNSYDSRFGLPFFPLCSSTLHSACFRKVNQAGAASPLPTTDAGWALETSLDVEVAHAICQNCTILLVEASSARATDLASAVSTAATLGATEISNSYGIGEFSGETSASWSQAYRHAGVVVTASSGDSGYGTSFPAALTGVVAVGGTSLRVNTDGSYAGESAWSGSGSGCSAMIAAPVWQTGMTGWPATGCGTRRAIADVAAGWFRLGGTSLASPLIAAVYALAADTSGQSFPAAFTYAHRSSLHDVTSGANGTCASVMCHAVSGYDGPTGLGTPRGLGGF